MAVRIINQAGASTRYGLARQSSDFPQLAFSVCLAMKLQLDRLNLFQSYTSLAYDNGAGFDATKRYWVIADGSGGVTHNFMVSNDGDDTPGTERPRYGYWYRMGFVMVDLGGGSYEYRFYYDLPDTSKVITRAITNLAAWDALTYFVLGSVPYTDFEGIDGWIANVKVFDVALTTAQLTAETVQSDLATASLSGNVWGRWPLVNDGNDISGNGRHVALRGSPTSSDVFFDGRSVAFPVARVNYANHPKLPIRQHYARSTP